MDTFISILNGVSSAVIAIALIVAVLSERVLDGLVIKVGLCSMALGFVVVSLHMLSDVDLQGLERAMLLINSGLAVVIIGYLLRYRSVGHALRRVTDWADLDEAEPEDERRKARP